MVVTVAVSTTTTSSVVMHLIKEDSNNQQGHTCHDEEHANQLLIGVMIFQGPSTSVDIDGG